MKTFYLPELLYQKRTFIRATGILVNEHGRIERICSHQEAGDAALVELHRKALLPGFVNAHSHSFQRLIRGKSESRALSGKDFWSWRGTVYHAASALSPEDVYDVARMAFLEMLFAGVTTVGEFHYLHKDQHGKAYDDPNLLSRQVIAAARSVGIRVVLLRAAYFRSGFELPRDPGQTRFFETKTDFLSNMEALLSDLRLDAEHVTLGIAPHSVRAVPLGDLKELAEWAETKSLPVHMHVAEQVEENAACTREYGCSPVRLLKRHKILSSRFTGIHCTHIDPEEVGMFAAEGATICSCPTTERNLGDGILAAEQVASAGIRVALGSDSQAQIDPLEDARELDYHLRLRDQQRVVLDQVRGEPIAERLFACATQNGAEALAVPAGLFDEGKWLDGFTVDLDDLSIAGHSAEDLLPLLVFALNRAAVRDVFVGGVNVVQDGLHPLHAEIVTRYQALHARVWQRSI